MNLSKMSVQGDTITANNVVQIVAGLDIWLSDNGDRSLVQLSNGWLIFVGWQVGVGGFIVYKSTDNGLTWTLLTTATAALTTSTSWSIASYGTMVYIAGSLSASTWFLKFDATTVPATNQSANAISIDTAQTANAECVLCVDKSTGAIHAAMLTKNATYSSMYNVRYTKSTDGGATWAARAQLTTSSGVSYNGLSLTLNVLGNPVITAADNATAANVNALVYNGSSWSALLTVFNGTTARPKNNTCVAMVPSGRLWCVWQGQADVSTSIQNIQAAFSDNNGASWSTDMVVNKVGLNVGTNNVFATLCITSDGIPWIVWDGTTVSGQGAHKSYWDGSAWTLASVDLASLSSQSGLTSIALSPYQDPMFVYRGTSGIMFGGLPTKYPAPVLEQNILEMHIPIAFAFTNELVSGSQTDTNGLLQVAVNNFYNYSNIDTQLFTLSSKWDKDQLFALEVMGRITSPGTATYKLWDFTAVAAVAGSAISTTSTQAGTTLRSASFKLIPGRTYGFVMMTSNSSYNAYCYKAILVVLGG